MLIGRGEIQLDGGRVGSSGGAGAIANEDNAITGWGEVELISNNGVIEANVAGKELAVGPGPGFAVNRGTMRATGGGALFLATGSSLSSHGGTVEALDGSSV